LVVSLAGTGREKQDVESVINSYRSGLMDDHRHMFDRFRIVDVARKAVGVGSVGTHCWIALFEGVDHPETDLIVLQVKEAQATVLEPYARGHTRLTSQSGSTEKEQ
jgi:uncharacterized protein (DUF2252 family)